MQTLTDQNAILRAAQEKLGWPNSDEIFSPVGVATRLTAQLADQKIGRALRELSGDDSIRVGVLASNANSTEAPLSLVCQFSRPAAVNVLLEAQRLAWNFSRSLLLLTVEPTLIRKWSCYETPKTWEEISPPTLTVEAATLDKIKTAQILPSVGFDVESATFTDENRAFELSWIDLLSGEFFAREEQRFQVEKRADQVLLDNLKFVRGRLRSLELADEWSHDLLARIIFVQFLFDRKDSSNRAALDPQKLAQLKDEGVLQGTYKNLSQLLNSYQDAYALFRWLNDRFNGDLFPGKGDSTAEREAGWKDEQQNVRPQHLKLLADFVAGELEMKAGQYCLWRQYAFDAIPLELLSSIYEEFVTDAVSAHYTPAYLVDLMLDRVLPWESTNWNFKILDPSCGSGIFLVKAYQRLIYRWKRAHDEGKGSRTEIPVAVLQQLLERNLFGVDKHLNAIRVASFSLYLAMCDEIDPRHYWSDTDRVRFPALRGQTLIQSDFFNENTRGFRTIEDAGTYDLVVGNPPWGDATASDSAKKWAEDYDWELANKDFGVLFLAKGMALVKSDCSVGMVQAAGALLYNRAPTAKNLQYRLFNGWKKVECIVNLSVFRELKLFKEAKGASCVAVFQNAAPDGAPFWYECPKPFHTPQDQKRITVDLNEMHSVYPDEVQSEPWIWSALMWGGARDRALLRKVKCLASIAELLASKTDSREGIVWGSRTKPQPEIEGRRILEDKIFPARQELTLNTTNLPINRDINIGVASSTSLDAFQMPQLLIKGSWTKSKNRFQARFVTSSQDVEGALCSQSYVSVHLPVERQSQLEAACLTYNSNWANYFLLLTSGRFAFGRPEPLTAELRSVPLPLWGENNTIEPQSAREFRTLLRADERGESVTLAEIDDAVYRAFEFQKTERILIEDLVQHTLSGFKERGQSPSYQPTARRSGKTDEPDLRRYCQTLMETLAQTYGADKTLGARIWSEAEATDSTRLPLRYISLIFDVSSQRGLQVHVLESRALRERMLQLYKRLTEKSMEDGYNRQVRDYEVYESGDESGFVLNIIKPDRLRHWTRSVALRDADEIARDFWLWQSGSHAAHAQNLNSQSQQREEANSW